jgi:hypothetical protein
MTQQTEEQLLNKIEELQELIKLGVSMRTHQISYFNKRSNEVFKDCKELEKKFDALAEKALAFGIQGELF